MWFLYVDNRVAGFSLCQNHYQVHVIQTAARKTKNQGYSPLVVPIFLTGYFNSALKR